VQLAEKEILIVVTPLVVHCCAIKKNAIVASQLEDVATQTKIACCDSCYLCR